MAGLANDQNHRVKEMGLEYVVIRKTTVIGDIKLPRPKIVQDVVFRGAKEEAEQHLERLALLPQNQSTDIINCEIKIHKYDGQKTGTSARPGNGKR